MSQSSSIGDRIAEKLIEPITRFADLKPVQSLKNGMLVVMPLTIIGSIFLLLANLPILAVQDWFTAIGLTPLLMQVFNATFSLIGLVACVAIAYNYVKACGHEPFVASIIALCAYVLFMSLTVTDAKTGQSVTGAIDLNWTGAKGMVVGIIVGELVGVVYSWFLKKKIVIRMPDGVPPAVANSFTALIPGAVILTAGMVLVAVFQRFDTTMFQAVYTWLQIPMQGLTDSVGGVVVFSLLIPFLWFFGIHGSSIVGGVLTPMTTANTVANQEILASGRALTLANGGHIVTQQFIDNCINMTGAGVTIGLVLYMVFRAKSAQYRTLGKLSIAPAIFNVNEPILFGTPIVMNPLMALPFIATPLMTGLLQYFALWSGLVPLYTGVMAPWTMPPILSGFIIGGWRTALMQVVVMALSIATYYPFIRQADKLLAVEEAALHAEHLAANAPTVTGDDVDVAL
ncbi:PTS sugar transporter subunit IIC [Raineyella sp. LH-20]|uniref:PTS sugar transporter subunit IIC n=1 Tax=Raineyella sp. LH-20 TaxID=3081204 RepID=UPI002954CE07|nr:PTS sugar transporter subunit IIC [Raineyella sp. LH-20]WOP19401.1 PTS sugar transporter subunit IIC [Raineyella sp. LH-20]